MATDLTDITLVVDRSGSMEAIRGDAEGGINAFIREQAETPGDALLTLVHFDTEYEFVHKGTPIREVPPYRLFPRGSTALLDAVGRAINETDERLAKLDEAKRPNLVLLVVMTDGYENSSHEFTKAQIKEMVEHRQENLGWHFTFLGADQDAFAEAGAMGMHYAASAHYDPNKVADAYAALSSKSRRMRAQLQARQQVRNEFSDEERRQME